MAALPDPLLQLVSALNKLPGIGPRSAERIALYLVQSDPAIVRQLAQTLSESRDRIRACEVCGGLTEQSPCAICSDPRRDQGLICIVERAVDIISIEKAGSFRGRFH